MFALCLPKLVLGMPFTMLASPAHAQENVFKSAELDNQL